MIIKKYFLIIIVLLHLSDIYSAEIVDGGKQQQYVVSFGENHEKIQSSLNILADKVVHYAFIKDFEAVKSWDDLEALNLNGKHTGGTIIAYLFLYKLCEFNKGSLFNSYPLDCDKNSFLERGGVNSFSRLLFNLLQAIIRNNTANVGNLRFFHVEYFNGLISDQNKKVNNYHDINSYYILGTVLKCCPKYCEQVQKGDPEVLFALGKLPLGRKKAAEKLKRLYPFLKCSFFKGWKEDILNSTHYNPRFEYAYMIVSILIFLKILYAFKNKYERLYASNA